MEAGSKDKARVAAGFVWCRGQDAHFEYTGSNGENAAVTRSLTEFGIYGELIVFVEGCL